MFFIINYHNCYKADTKGLLNKGFDWMKNRAPVQVHGQAPSEVQMMKHDVSRSNGGSVIQLEQVGK